MAGADWWPLTILGCHAFFCGNFAEAPMLQYFKAAIDNIYRHGDTDIFPFPIENRILFDQREEISSILFDYFRSIRESFAQNSPIDIRSLVPIHHSGFRWGTQMDPMWNCMLLACVLSIAEKIEGCRLDARFVFSYRLNQTTYMQGDLFRKDVSWRDFSSESVRLSEEFNFVVTCDVADCYSRISHHKLDNSLRIINCSDDVRYFVLEYLKYLTDTRSAGLPIGGPAARILAELALNNIDQYISSSGLRFVRFADDYHFFCGSRKEAYDVLVKLHSALDNEGLTLQKSKTRILSSAEFRAINSFNTGDGEPSDSPAQRLMRLSLRFDPYATDAEEQYQELKDQLSKIDITALLNEQLSQTRVHIPTTRKIIEALRHLDSPAQYGAAISMLGNMDSLYPIASSVFQTIDHLMSSFDESQKETVSEKIISLYDDGHEVMSIATHVAFSNRILARHKCLKNQNHLTKCYDRELDVLVRRDIILIFANWSNFAWLSMFRARFGSASPWERRAFILASYAMSDEGKHWRDHVKSRFDRFELLVRDWRATRLKEAIPL